MNNYACINVPATLIKELKRLKKEKAITTISEFATDSIKKSIQNMFDYKQTANAFNIEKPDVIKDNTSVENFREAAVAYLDNKDSNKIEKFLGKVCQFTTRMDVVNPTVNNFLDSVFSNAVDIIDLFDYHEMFSNSITLNYEIANTLAVMRVAVTTGFAVGDWRARVDIETLRILGKL